MRRPPAEQYVVWVDRRRWPILLVSLAITIVGGFAATRLPVYAGLQNLLPASRPSVHDLNTLQRRARPFGTVQVVIDAPTPELAKKASEDLSPRLASLPPDLVASFSADDQVLHRYLWDHRFQLAKMEDLLSARDALARRIEQAKLDANPLYVQLDDDDKPATKEPDRLDALIKKLDDAERAAKDTNGRVSKDGLVRMLMVQTTFPASDTPHANKLLRQIREMTEQTRSVVGKQVKIGLTGHITFGMYEHDSVLDGMTLSSVLTVLLCAIALLLYYRSGVLVLSMLWALGVGIAATLVLTKVMIGNLNLITAFVFAIVVGNGINAGLIVVARFLEARRTSDGIAAIAVAVSGTLRGTLAATATAAVAYVSLMVADFRAFQQFGAIACAGMLMTWVTTFVVLPALLCVLTRTGRLKARLPQGIGDVLAWLLPDRRRTKLLVLGALVTAASLVVVIVFLERGPFTHDWRDLQTSSASIENARRIDRRGQTAFDRASSLTTQAFQFAVAVQRREDVAPMIAQIRADNESRAPDQRWLDGIYSFDDLVPSDQDQKLAVLAEIRGLLDDLEAKGGLDDDERAKLERVRPPADIPTIKDSDVPEALAWPFTERDGTRGRIIVCRGTTRFKAFNLDHRLAFAAEIRKIALPAGAIVAGETLLFADIIKTMESDAPPMIGLALIGSVLTVLLLVGLARQSVVTIVCGLSGVVVMIAACALVGLKVHFVDLIALPITIGIGIDYAVNLAARDRIDGALGPALLLRTTGGTVLLCSYTTMVGYGTLLLSANGGIRAFGLAALLGELACITMALAIAPAWLAAWRDRSR